HRGLAVVGGGNGDRPRHRGRPLWRPAPSDGGGVSRRRPHRQPDGDGVRSLTAARVREALLSLQEEQAPAGERTRSRMSLSLRGEDLVWPRLPPYDEWADTCQTLHLWTQILGKLKLALAPEM